LIVITIEDLTHFENGGTSMGTHESPLFKTDLGCLKIHSFLDFVLYFSNMFHATTFKIIIQFCNL
jgi:hypothetical protein